MAAAVVCVTGDRTTGAPQCRRTPPLLRLSRRRQSSKMHMSRDCHAPAPSRGINTRSRELLSSRDPSSSSSARAAPAGARCQAQTWCRRTRLSNELGHGGDRLGQGDRDQRRSFKSAPRSALTYINVHTRNIARGQLQSRSLDSIFLHVVCSARAHRRSSQSVSAHSSAMLSSRRRHMQRACAALVQEKQAAGRRERACAWLTCRPAWCCLPSPSGVDRSGASH